MPIPDFPTLPVADTDPLDPVDYYDLFVQPTSPADAFSVINGYLTDTSISGSFAVGYQYTQRRSHVDCEGASGTAALDFRPRYLFPGVRGFSPLASLAAIPYKPIPGGCRTFYSKWSAKVLVTWSVYWLTYYTVSSERANDIFLTLDGSYVNPECRRQAQTTNTSDVKGYQRARAWCGHSVVDVAPGWHDAALNIVVDNRNGNARIHSVNMSVLQFKTGNAL